MTHGRGRIVAAAPLLASGLVLAGCMGAPTYGTGTPADEQLLSDVTGILSITPSNKKEPIDYKPRPDLVKPAPGEAETLPPPQENIVTASAASGSWPESPEQRRKRLRDEATANQNNPAYQSPIVSDVMMKSKGGVTSSARFDRGNFEIDNAPQQREAFNQRLAQTRQGDPTSRKYLSEPPLEYRLPSDSAPTGDVGEDEWKKERRQKRAAKKGSSWRDLLPF